MLASKLAIVIDTAYMKYFGPTIYGHDLPRIGVEEILSSLEAHGRQEKADDRVDDMLQCDEAVRSLIPIAPGRARACIDSWKSE
jgi:hypothetical protein